MQPTPVPQPGKEEERGRVRATVKQTTTSGQSGVWKGSGGRAIQAAAFQTSQQGHSGDLGGGMLCPLAQGRLGLTCLERRTG